MVLSRLIIGLLAFGAVFCAGCKSYDQQIRSIRANYMAGALVSAAEEAESNALDADTADSLVWQLETATILRTQGDIAKSQVYFQLADDRYVAEQEKAKISISKEGMSLLTNPAQLPYRGALSDGIMLSVYQALNYLEQGDEQKARVQIVRSYLRQQDAVDENAKRITAERDAVEKDKSSTEINQTAQSPAATGVSETLQENLPDTRGYENYVNPFAVYLDALFHLYKGVDMSDRERARKTFNRVASLAPANEYIRQDLALIETQSTPPPAVYVIFETGLAPYRKEYRFDLPIVLSRVSYIGVAFPQLEFSSGAADYLQVSVPAANAVYQTQVVCDMDKVVAHEFKNDLPGIMTRAIASAVAKAVGAYAANEVANNASQTAGLVSQLVTAIYQYATNIADTRGWTLRPKTFQLCKLPIPADRRIAIATPGMASTSIDVMPGQVVVVYVRSPSIASPLFVRQFILRPEPLQNKGDPK